jgi:hypothetical protein
MSFAKRSMTLLKRISLILTLTLSAGSFLSSCDPCANLDCISDNYFGQFRIISTVDGKDLVFGNSKIYDKDNIKFYALNGPDTTRFDYETQKLPGNGYDSILYVRFFPRSDTAYMRLSNGDIDTFQISYKTIDSRCCGTITEISSYRFNSAINIPGSEGTQEIRK